MHHNDNFSYTNNTKFNLIYLSILPVVVNPHVTVSHLLHVTREVRSSFHVSELREEKKK